MSKLEFLHSSLIARPLHPHVIAGLCFTRLQIELAQGPNMVSSVQSRKSHLLRICLRWNTWPEIVLKIQSWRNSGALISSIIQWKHTKKTQDSQQTQELIPQTEVWMEIITFITFLLDSIARLLLCHWSCQYRWVLLDLNLPALKSLLPKQGGSNRTQRQLHEPAIRECVLDEPAKLQTEAPSGCNSTARLAWSHWLWIRWACHKTHQFVRFYWRCPCLLLQWINFIDEARTHIHPDTPEHKHYQSFHHVSSNAWIL